jgi:hypothetical protein
MRKLLILSPLVLALALGACEDKTAPGTPAAPGGEVKTPASPEPGPPTPEDEPSDGGAEQPSSEPIPPAPGPPAQPPTPPAPSPATFNHDAPGRDPGRPGPWLSGPHGVVAGHVLAAAGRRLRQFPGLRPRRRHGSGRHQPVRQRQLRPALARHLLRGPLARQSAVRRRRHGPPGPGHPPWHLQEEPALGGGGREGRDHRHRQLHGHPDRRRPHRTASIATCTCRWRPWR